MFEMGRQKRTRSLELPAILRGDVLVPLKIDITLGGARYVDTFTWNLDTESCPEEFAARTCADLNLHPGFQTRICLQITEQVEAFRTIVDVIKMALQDESSPISLKMKEPQLMVVGIRHQTLDYSDKFHWDLMSTVVTPELFASITCSDLGLPSEMEPAISHKIRELIFRSMIHMIEDPASPEITTNSAIAKVMIIQSAQSVDMGTKLWKTAKPSTAEEQAYVPMPNLPDTKFGQGTKDTNSSIWTV